MVQVQLIFLNDRRSQSGGGGGVKVGAEEEEQNFNVFQTLNV